ncbi:MAG: recombination mediator RecR [Myxococcota bacterium]|nr:recombination mediator RecR [Myxococcota bacterium]
MRDTVDPLRKCVAQLSRLPGVGERTATRLAYWLLRQEPDVAAEIGAAIQELRVAMVRCSICQDISSTDPCHRCADPRRDSSLICVVERPQDIVAIEASGEFRGRFHVLHGAISPLEGVGPDDLTIRALLGRLADGVDEVLVATDPDVEGDATALYLARVIKPLGVRVTRLAHGIAVGTELEFADRSSVARALANRRDL